MASQSASENKRLDNDPAIGKYCVSRRGKSLRALLALTLLLGGCVTVKVADRGRSRIFVGVVRVVLPDKQGAVSAIDVKALGVGWDAGPYLGWKSGNWIIADPADCQLLIVIRSPAQAANAARVIQSLGGQNPCIADFTHSLRP